MKTRVLVQLTLWIAAVLLLLAGPSPAQQQSGSLYGTVVGEDGRPLPGVAVALSGVGAPQVQTTDGQGRFRFLGLPPGLYAVRADLQGYSPLEHAGIEINVGRNVFVEVKLSEAIRDTTYVTGSPLLDTRGVTAGKTVSEIELQKIPTARDPWALLQTVPGVLTDRINVGGNESGQQARFVGPGSSGGQAVWSLDGINVTDRSALGSSSGYYDFDAFEELQVTTGGSDASVATGGVSLNMVTRRGTNRWRGSARYIVSDNEFQSDTNLDESDLAQAGPWNNNRAQPAFKQGNRIVEVTDTGAELGGPAVRDRLWLWASYARPETHLLTIDDYSDKSTIETANLKLNAQISPSNSATAFAWHSDRMTVGRGAGPLRPPETTWRQSGFGPDPSAWKIEDTQIFGSSFFVTGLYSEVYGGFQFQPQGGEAVSYLDPDGVWHNSFLEIQIERPQQQVKADASSFWNSGSIAHELKYGAGYLEAEQRSISRWPGGGLDLDSFLLLSREGKPTVRLDTTSAFLQDTLAVGSLTANVGLRWDRQGGENLPTSVRANPAFPELLPAVQYPGGDSGFTWSTISPRLGLTWALGKEKKTVVRGSYSRFADQLGTEYAGWLNPLGFQSYRYFYSYNAGGRTLEPGDLGFEFSPPSGNVDPITLGPLQSNAVDPDFEAPVTDEVLLGSERALRPDFVVGLHLTWRRYTGIPELERLLFEGDSRSPENLARLGRPHRREDYRPGPPVTVTGPDGRSYTATYWELQPGLTSRGFLLENGDREQDFKGAFLTFNKRLANRWLMRGHFGWQDWKWRIPDSENEDPTDNVAGGVLDGSEVLNGSRTVAGPKGHIFLNADWSYNVNGMYQIAPDRPWGVNVAANVSGRQGYPIRYARRVFRETVVDEAGQGLFLPLTPSTEVDDYRYPDVHVVDLRVEKEIRFQRGSLVLGVDVFNAMNEAYVLQRSAVLGRANGDYVTEILSPRVVRLGARVSFR
ncbi:MAG TPA: TonB-dependent receptor [Thermoanaerobaculia bacterium]|nr:TonB-dependent receptor [Thermoanaerobaculia bacterium]